MTIPEPIPRFVPVPVKEPIADEDPLNEIFETVTPGPSKTFCTKETGLPPGEVTNCPKA